MSDPIAALAERCGELTINDLIKPGVYILVRDNQVVYVGQSDNIIARIGTHARRLEFDLILHLVIGEKAERLAIEGALARRFNPPNVSRVSKRYVSRDAEILARFGLEPDSSAAAEFDARASSCWSLESRLNAAREGARHRTRRKAMSAGKSPRAVARAINKAVAEVERRWAKRMEGL